MKKKITNGGCGATANTAASALDVTQQDWQTKSRCSANAEHKQSNEQQLLGRIKRNSIEKAIWHHKRMQRRWNVKKKEVSPMGQDEEPQHLCLSLLGLNKK